MSREIIITNEMITEAQELASKGMTMDQIAGYFGLGERTLYEKQIEYPQLAHALKKGRNKGIKIATNLLFEKMMSKDSACIMFYLKCRAGWKEKDIEEELIQRKVESTTMESIRRAIEEKSA